MRYVLHSSILLKAVSDMQKSCLKKHLAKKKRRMLSESLQQAFRFVLLNLSERQTQASCLTLSRMSILRLLHLYFRIFLPHRHQWLCHRFHLKNRQMLQEELHRWTEHRLMLSSRLKKYLSVSFHHLLIRIIQLSVVWMLS